MVNRPSDFEMRQLELLAIRSTELADRVTAGTIGFLDAVDAAATAAEWSGLTDSVGADAVQKILAASFAGIGRG
jgi:hypothetical protein